MGNLTILKWSSEIKLEDVQMDREIEISQKQYNIVNTKCSGVIFHRTENTEIGKKYFIKPCWEKYIKEVFKILKENE